MWLEQSPLTGKELFALALNTIRQESIQGWERVNGKLFVNLGAFGNAKLATQLLPGPWLTCTSLLGDSRKAARLRNELRALHLPIWNEGWEADRIAREWKRLSFAEWEQHSQVCYPVGSGLPAPSLTSCRMWWMHLFEEASDTLQVDDFMRCLLTRFLHVINRYPAPESGPLQILRANALLQSMEQFVLPILVDLTPADLVAVVCERCSPYPPSAKITFCGQ